MNGPILLIDDDPDDCSFTKAALEDLRLENELLCFDQGKKALDYLRSTTQVPLIILSDINMPIMGGLELRKVISKDEYLCRKAVPFIFLTTTAAPHAVKEAYELSVQGFFQKPSDYDQLKSLLQQIISYWKQCYHPNSLKK